MTRVIDCAVLIAIVIYGAVSAFFGAAVALMVYAATHPGPLQRHLRGGTTQRDAERILDWSDGNYWAIAITVAVSWPSILFGRMAS